MKKIKKMYVQWDIMSPNRPRRKREVMASRLFYVDFLTNVFFFMRSKIKLVRFLSVYLWRGCFPVQSNRPEVFIYDLAWVSFIVIDDIIMLYVCYKNNRPPHEFLNFMLLNTCAVSNLLMLFCYRWSYGSSCLPHWMILTGKFALLLAWL